MTKTLNKKINNQILILVVLGFFAVSVGLWGNYRQLWLASNNLSAASISRVISIASVVAALSLLFYTKKFSINKIRMGMIATLLIKLFISILLLLIDQTSNAFLIKFLSFFDIACENIILSSVYPFIICYQRSEELYGKKDVVENLGKTTGILLGCLLFGKMIFNHTIGFKTCLLITIFFNLLALFVMSLTSDREKTKIEEKNASTLKYLLDNKLLIFYLIYNMISNMSFSVVIGLKMLMITDFANFSTSTSTLFILVLAVIDIVFGALAISKIKTKNDYINISIKFLVRLVMFILVALSNNVIIMLIAMAYCLATNIAYGSIVNGYMLNTVKEKYILDFTVINYIGNLVGEAAGVFLAGIMYVLGFRYIFLSAIPIVVLQLIMAYYLVYRKRKNNK